jgi:hypothetical protein
MPTYASGGYINGMDAGTQVSSTYEGRHIEVEEQDMIHSGAALVTKGTPVLFNDLTWDAMVGVGVALNTATAVTDFIAVDTEGIWNLSVVSSSDITGAIANDDIVFGDQIFIDISTGVLSKIRNANTNRPFGYSVNTTTVTGAGTATVIPVKVHWDPWALSVAMPLCGVSGAPFVNDQIGVTFRQFRYDSGATSGDNRGEYLRVYYTGAGGGGDCLRVYADVVGVAAANVFGAHISAGFGESTTGGSVTGLGVACRATLGLPDVAMAAGGTYAAIMPEIYSFGAAADAGAVTELSFIRCVNDGNAAGIADVDDDAFLLVYTGGATAGGNVVEESATEGNYAYSARCKLNGVTCYMMFASAVG